MYLMLAMFFVRPKEDESKIASMMKSASSRSSRVPQTQWTTASLIILALGLVAYVLCRIALLPTHPETSEKFGHISAANIIVAQNLLAGRGYVNDAHWLVCLQPSQLPIAYHNANPLYPTLVAGLAYLTGDVIRAAIVVSIVAHALLFPVLVWLLQPFVPIIRTRVLVALAGVCFPPIFADSLAILPDALFTTLMFAFLACVLRLESTWGTLLAGLLMGLAWLTRSSVILVVPGVVLLLFLWYERRDALRRISVMAVASLIVASPWLIRNLEVWGTPTHSDASYCLLQDYHIRHSKADVNESLERFYHSPEKPPANYEVILGEPKVFGTFLIQASPEYFRILVGEWTGSSRIVAWVLLVHFLLASLIVFVYARQGDSVHDARVRRLLFVTLCTADLFILVYLPRVLSMEIRYLSFVSIALAMLLMGGACLAYRHWNEFGSSNRIVYGLLIVASVAFWAGFVPMRNLQLFEASRQTNAYLETYFEDARTVRDLLPERATVVVGTHPYLFTLRTGLPSLSMPTSDDAYLQEYMDRYGANYVYLTEDELKRWKPDWKEPEARPKDLRRVETQANGYLFERKDSQ